MPRGEQRSLELLEGIAATSANLGIDVADIIWFVQTEPLKAIERLTVVHESLGWINKEVNRAKQAWIKEGKPDIYTSNWAQGSIFAE